MNNQRMKWDAEAAFKRDEIRLSLSEARERAWASCTCDPLDLEAGMANDDCAVHSRALDYDGSETRTPRRGWTPAPTKPAYSQTNVNAHLGHKGRDYEALTKAALRKPVGYWEDAPRGIKFGGGGTAEKRGEIKPPEGPRAAPTAPPQSADGPWPKWVANTQLERIRLDGEGGADWYASGGSKGYCLACIYEPRDSNSDLVYTSESEAAQWLESHGHAEVAAQLRGKGATQPRDDVATGARVWKWKGVRGCPNGCYVDVGGVMYYKERETFWRRSCAQNADRADAARHIELHGPERDAIVAECRKAMGI